MTLYQETTQPFAHTLREVFDWVSAPKGLNIKPLYPPWCSPLLDIVHTTSPENLTKQWKDHPPNLASLITLFQDDDLLLRFTDQLKIESLFRQVVAKSALRWAEQDINRATKATQLIQKLQQRAASGIRRELSY